MSTPIAAATSILELLRDHIGHRTTVVEPQPGRSIAVKCVDCTRLLDLSSVFGLRPSSAAIAPALPEQPPARRGSPSLTDPDACALHPGFWADSCGPCRSEVLAAGPPRTPDAAPRTDPPPEWQALRDRFARPTRRTGSRPNDPSPNQEPRP